MRPYADLHINFWTGCAPVSGGCRECIEQFAGITEENPDIVPDLNQEAPEVTPAQHFKKGSQQEYLKPYTLKNQQNILVNDRSDFFAPQGDSQWRTDAWLTIKNNPQHRWFICTKYPERIEKCLPADWGQGYTNVYLGISAERQSIFHYRAIKLLEISCHGRFVVFEPLLEPITIEEYISIKLGDVTVNPFSWVLIGGEYGVNPRICKLPWIQSIVAECIFMGIPVYVKQLGTIIANELQLASKIGDDKTENKYPPTLRYEDTPKKP